MKKLAILLSCLALANLANAQNTAYGSGALSSLTTGTYNSAFGEGALHLADTAYQNTAIGYNALYSTTSSGGNIAIGINSLFTNTTGNNNIALGGLSLFYNADGYQNISVGQQALFQNTSGYFNIALGGAALFKNATGNGNVAIGNSALGSNVSGVSNIGINGGTATTGSFNILIGNPGAATENATIRIGDTQQATYIAGIYGQQTGPGTFVCVDANGKLGDYPSGLPSVINMGAYGAMFILPGILGPLPYTGGPESFTVLLNATTTSTARTADLTVDTYGLPPTTSGPNQNVLVPPNNTTWFYRIHIVGRGASVSSVPAASRGITRWGIIKNTGGVITSVTEAADTVVGDSTCPFTASLNSSLNGYLRYTVNQVNTTWSSVKWTARVEITSAQN